MLAQKYGLSVRQATKSACAPLLDVDPSHFGTKDCAAYNDAMVHELVTGPRPRTTVLVARWSLYNDIYQRLDHTIDRLNALGISVLILGQTPEFSSDPNTCFIRRAMTHAIAKDCLRQSLMSVKQRLNDSEAILMKLTNGRAHALYVGLDEILCDRHNCWAESDSHPLYRDEHHLSLAGAREVGAALAENTRVKALLSTYSSSRQ